MTSKTSVLNFFLNNQWISPQHNIIQGFVFVQIFQKSYALLVMNKDNKEKRIGRSSSTPCSYWGEMNCVLDIFWVTVQCLHKKKFRGSWVLVHTASIWTRCTTGSSYPFFFNILGYEVIAPLWSIFSTFSSENIIK